MTYAQIITAVRKLTDEQIQTNRLVNDDIGLWVTVAYDEIASDIIQLKVGYFGTVNNTIDLLINVSDYTLPDLDSNGYNRIEHVFHVKIKYSGSNFITAKPLDYINIPDTTFENIVFSENDPRYLLNGNTLTIFPAASGNITDGIKLWYAQRPAPLTSDNQVPQISPAYHMLIVYRAAILALSQEVDPEYGGIIDRYERSYNNLWEKMIANLNTRESSWPETITGTRSTQAERLGSFYIRPGAIQ